jgi:hypothetical protein
MLTKRNREENDWKMPRVWRAAIYLREPAKDERTPHRELSVIQQRIVCRCAATVLHAEVDGEFTDERQSSPSRPGLRRMLERAGQRPRIDYLVISSLDRLAADRDEAFEIAWRLGFAGTVVIPTDAEGEFPWTGSAPSSRH